MSVIKVRLRSPGGVGILPNWTDFEAEVPDSPTPPPPGPPPGPTPEYLTRPFVLQHLSSEVYGHYLTPSGAPCVAGPRGSGPVDAEYYTDVVIETGGWVNPTARGENNIGYWSDKIGTDLLAHGYRRR